MAYERVEPFARDRVDYWGKQILFAFLAVNRSASARPIKMRDVAAPWEDFYHSGDNQDLNDQIKQAFGGNNG